MRLPLTVRTNASRLPQAGKKRPRSPDEKVPVVSFTTNARTLPKPGTNLFQNYGEAAQPEKKCRVETVKPAIKKSKSTTVLRRQVSSTLATKRAPPQRNVPVPAKSVKPPPSKTKPPVNVPPVKQSTSKPNATAVPGVKKSRPAWDLKGRLQDMEAYMQKQSQDSSTLQTQFSQNNDRIAQLELQNQKLHGDVKEKEMASDTALKQIDDLTSKLRKTEDDLFYQKRTMEREIESLKEQKSCLDRQRSSLEGELEDVRKEKASLKSSLTELIAAQSSMKAELESVKILLETAHRDIRSKDQKIEERGATIEMLEQKDREHETARRKLHNTIQELKGNIRVFCRVRPLLGEEHIVNNGILSHISFPDTDHRIVELDRLSDVSVNESMLNSTRTGKLGSRYEFTFDRVFEPENTQADVFEEISQLVQSSLDGYNVCIFAYGQTGSGKTFTMEGNLSDPACLGMIPRAVSQIFSTASHLQTKGWQYKFEASMMEIYNETIRDLLAKTKDEKYEIKMDGKTGGSVYVSNLTVTEVTREDQVLKLLNKACLNRSVAETKSNERSSRSHSVFQIKINGKNDLTGETSEGTLNLIDLAGSERVKDSGSEGQRLLEAQCINKSLSNLGNVIMALGNKDKHIPYRNSKLTYLLQNSLGGNSKTLMFVNVSPKEECFGETLNSLRFATKVNQCFVGTAQQKKK